MWERFPLKRGVGRLTTEESWGSAHMWHICDGALFICLSLLLCILHTSYQNDLSKIRPGHSATESPLWPSSAHSSLSHDVLQHQAFHQQWALDQPCMDQPPKDRHCTLTLERLWEYSRLKKYMPDFWTPAFLKCIWPPQCSFPSIIFCPPQSAGVVRTGMADLLDKAPKCPLEITSVGLHGTISHPPASHYEL